MRSSSYGRVVCLVSTFLPLWLAAAVDLAFPFVLSAVAAREIIVACNWRNVMIPVPIGVLGLADLLMYLELAGVVLPAGLGSRLALVAIIVLISVIGGRIIPAFTRNWLLRRGACSLPGKYWWPDRMALGTLHVGVVGWAFFPTARAVGMILIVSAAFNLWRLSRWRGLSTAPEPLLAIPHVGYGWLVIGTALLGASLLSDRVPQAATVHALTVGAIGTMILAVMTRVTRGHTGRQLVANRLTSLMYVLINLAAISRIMVAWFSAAFTNLLGLSAVLWVASFGLFILSYWPLLSGPRADVPID